MEKAFFDQSVKSDMSTCDYKMIAIDSNSSSKQQTLDADPKAIQQINFTGNLDWAESATFFSLLKKQKKPF